MQEGTPLGFFRIGRTVKGEHEIVASAEQERERSLLPDHTICPCREIEIRISGRTPARGRDFAPRPVISKPGSHPHDERCERLDTYRPCRRQRIAPPPRAQ